jgi:hypothetical protein
MWLFVCFLSSVLAFYGGLILGWHTAPNDNNCGGTGGGGGLRTVASPQETTLIASLQKRQRELEAQLQMANATTTAAKSSSSSSSSSLVSPHFSDAFETSHTGGFASGMEFVDRDDFASVFDVGVPLDASSKGNDRVLLVYSDPKAFPNTKTQTTAKTTTTTTALSALDATANCHNLHLVYTQKRDRQCLAIMGQYESFHVHKYMRIDQKTKKMDAKHPLVYVDRGRQQNGRISAKVPTIEATKEHWTGLTAYLQSLETALEQIKPTLEAVASHNSNNAIIVLVSNFGHSELLANCACVRILCCVVIVLLDRPGNQNYRCLWLVVFSFVWIPHKHPLYCFVLFPLDQIQQSFATPAPRAWIASCRASCSLRRTSQPTNWPSRWESPRSTSIPSLATCRNRPRDATPTRPSGP